MLRTFLCRILITVAIGASFLSGCFAPPRVEDDPNVRYPSEFERTVFEDYWIRHDVPFLQDRGIHTVAITEFSVEFVTVKQLKGLPGGAAKVDIAQFTPIGAGLNLLGVGRRNADFEETFMRDLPQQLFESFRQIINRRGVRVLPVTTVAASRAYGHYITSGKGKSSIFNYVNPLGSDTGRIRKTVTYPHQGLGIITGASQGDIEDVDALLMHELKADLVLRARFRVGVHEGAASIERGSVITVTGKDVLGHLESGRSLISTQSVLKGGGFIPLKGSTYEVSNRRYEIAMKSLFPRYLELAMEYQ